MRSKHEKGKYDDIAEKFDEEKVADNASQFHHSIYDGETVKLKVSALEEILDYPNPEFLIEPLLYKKTANLLTAYAGVGKSLLSLSIAHAIVTGTPLWQQFHVHRKGPVLIVDEENPGSFLKDRLVKMGFNKGMPIYFMHYQSVKLDNAGCFISLLDAIKKLKPVLVIFDALIRVHNAKENDNSEMAHVMGKIRELINRTGVATLVIHHERKGYGDKKERARGSGDIVGAVDTQLCLEPKEDGSLILSSGKTRVAPYPPIRLKLSDNEEKLSFIYLGREASLTDSILNEVVEILGEKSMSVNDLWVALKSRDIPIGINNLRGILKKAVGKVLFVEKRARGILIYRVNSTFTASQNI